MKKSTPRILIVEDEEMVRRMLAGALKEYNVEQSASGSEALIKAGGTHYQVALIDLMLPDINGIEVLGEIKKLQPHCQVVVMTGHASISSAIRSIRMGAFDFIEKPFSLTDIRQVIEKAIRATGAIHSGALPEEAAAAAGRVGLVGFGNREMQALLATAYKVAAKNICVMISGETGTGKELLARFIHAASPRAERIFLPVNCGALSESIVESELFGHEKGSFTGADRRHRGCFELADRGTIFLDEVGDASPGLQAKLLRVLESGEFQRVGGEEFVRVDVRILAATNVDLEKAVQKKIFREDLYYRLAAVRLTIPPLRSRQEDILPLAEHFLRRVSNYESGDVPVLSPEAAEALSDYSWHGNVRELANVIHQAVALTEENIILPEHLSACLKHGKWKPSAMEWLSLNDGTRPPVLKELEKSAIVAALRYCRGNVKAASLVLGIGRATMHRKIKEYDIDLARSVYLIETEDLA